MNTQMNPDSGVEETRPDLQTLHQSALTLLGLVVAMNNQAECIGQDGMGLYACIEVALPIAKKLAGDLERVM